MKKIIVSVLVILSLLTGAVMLTACVDGDEELSIKNIEAEVEKGTVYRVGDTFDTSTILVNARLSDDTTTEITNASALHFDKSELKLENNKFTEAGEFEIEITYLRYKVTIKITVS